MPLICSRSTWFHAVDAVLHLGELRVHPQCDLTHGQEQHGDGRRRGSMTADRLRGMAKKRPPMIMIGAVTKQRERHQGEDLHLGDVRWVMRVISEGAPNCPTSRAEYPITVWKRSRRMSRPKPMAERGAVETWPRSPNVTWMKVTPSMTAPHFPDVAVRPPCSRCLSMMSAFNVGRVNVAIDWIVWNTRTRINHFLYLNRYSREDLDQHDDSTPASRGGSRRGKHRRSHPT